jgi:hypothetical protein
MSANFRAQNIARCGSASAAAVGGHARAAQLCENSDRDTDADHDSGREAYGGKHTQGADGNIRERGADSQGRGNVSVPTVAACLGAAAYLLAA